LFVSLNRQNLFTVIGYVKSELDGIFVLLEIAEESAIVRLRNGVTAEITPRTVEQVKHFSNRSEFEILSLRDNVGTVKLNELNIQLSGPFDVLTAILDEMISDSYYHEVDVKSKVVVDVGGAIGDTALYFASRGAKCVYMFEPLKEFVDYARKNIRQFKNIYLYDYGLWSCNTSGKGEIDGTEALGFMHNASEALTEILKREGKIDLLKIDCEGCEWNILPSLNKSLLEKISQIYVEIHGDNHSALISKLEECGFVTLVNKKNPSHTKVSMYLLTRMNNC